MSCTLSRIIQIKEAIQYQRVKVWDGSKDISSKCKYSWSNDGVCWTSWTTIDIYDRVCKDLEGDFYLRIKIFSNFTGVELNDSFTDCYNICIDSETTFIQDFCGETNLFQPYNNLDCAIQLQQQLSDSVVCLFGIPIYYIQINPYEDATDYTFKEHFLHHVSSIKQLKLIIPDGQMPSSNPKLTEFDFDWEVDWETELSKTQFANAFGDTAYPKTGDCIWIPMMNRMWEVNSAYDERNEGLMWRSTTWKLALVKYTESTNVDASEFDGLIDQWVDQTYENTFGQIERNEQHREVGADPLSSPKYAATNLYDIFMEDSVRKQYTKQDTNILDKTYNHRSIVVARNTYRFKNENGCITYQKKICGDEGVIMFILETPASLQGQIERDVLNFGEVQCKLHSDSQKLIIKFGELEQELEPFKSYMVFLKWNRSTYSTELCIYNYTHRMDRPVYNLRPEMYWFDFENPICELVGVYNNDYDMREPMNCQVHFYPASVTNVRYYNKYMSQEESIKESTKYTTTHENCIINDVARPISSGHGYAVK
jgi:hypothetical protein